MPKTRKTRHYDDGTAKYHEDLVKQHYLAMKRGELPAERKRISAKHYDEEADAKYANYFKATKKYLRNTPKMGGSRTRRRRHRTRR